MKHLLKLAALAGGLCLAAPANAQTLMPNFSFPEMRAVLTALKATVTQEDVENGHRYIEAKTEDGLIFQVYGFECGTSAATDALQRCTGAEILASFTMAKGKLASDAAKEIDYASVADAAVSDSQLELRRYIIFDNGITPANLQTNVSVFLSIADKVWGKLTDEKFLN